IRLKGEQSRPGKRQHEQYRSAKNDQAAKASLPYVARPAAEREDHQHWAGNEHEKNRFQSQKDPQTGSLGQLPGNDHSVNGCQRRRSQTSHGGYLERSAGNFAVTDGKTGVERDAGSSHEPSLKPSSESAGKRQSQADRNNARRAIPQREPVAARALPNPAAQQSDQQNDAGFLPQDRPAWNAGHHEFHDQGSEWAFAPEAGGRSRPAIRSRVPRRS